VYGIHVDCRAIEHRKSAVLTREGEEQVGSAEKDGLGTQIPMHPFPRREKRLSLALGDPTGLGHFNVAPMYTFECVTFGATIVAEEIPPYNPVSTTSLVPRMPIRISPRSRMATSR